jgi:peptidoglycan/LPS O-acetylase OafA/YrhL
MLRHAFIGRSWTDCASTPFWECSSITRCPSGRPSIAWLTEQPGPVDMRAVAGRLVVPVGAVLILYACLGSRSRLLRSGWVVRLGKISYGLYMLHFLALLLVLDLLPPLWGWELLAAKGLGLALTVVLAWASYRSVESPFLRWKDRFATVLSRPV